MSYLVFGMQMPGRKFDTDGYRYGYQGSEKDDEIAGEGNSYMTHYRFLDPRIGRWKSVDPKANLMPWQSPYTSMENNPVLLNDPDGDCPTCFIWLFGYFKIADKLEKSTGNDVMRSIGYSMKHPINANMVNGYGTNINDVATNFQVNIGIAIKDRTNNPGGRQNAIRHTLWQSLLTRDINEKQASRIGYAHEQEGNKDYSLDWNVFVSGSTDDQINENLESADRIVDLLNNKIGRKIAKSNPKATNVEMALLVLKEYYTNGLWTLKESENGRIQELQLTKLTEEQYKAAVKEVNKKGENGLNKR
ncbi:MAG: RHS repeat domain-containing protein [Flavobacteriales bacterium]